MLSTLSRAALVATALLVAAPAWAQVDLLGNQATRSCPGGGAPGQPEKAGGFNWGQFRQLPVVSQGVQAWEAGRSAWDLVSGGLTKHRGDIQPADSARLRRLVEQRPAPYGPADLFRAARTVSCSDREALERCMALSIDEHGMKLRQLQGIESEDVQDKYCHFFASAVMAHRSNAQASFNVGWGKEVLDELAAWMYEDKGSLGFDERDLQADALGASFGQALRRGVVEEF